MEKLAKNLNPTDLDVTLVAFLGTKVQAQQEPLDTRVTEDYHICALEAISQELPN